MIRKSTVNISYSNKNKLDKLDEIFKEAIKVINLYIDVLWINENFKSSFVDFKVESWLSARMQQCLGKQALEIVKSQREKEHKTKPLFTKNTIELDSRFIELLDYKNSFDIWFKITSIGNKIKLLIPAKKHYHYNLYNNWNKKKSFKLRKKNNNYFIDVYFDKTVELKQTGSSKAVDIGYKKLIVSSNAEYLGNNSIYEKISRKQVHSKAFKKALIERDELVNRACKDLDLKDVKTLYAEDLKDVKRGSKGKIRKLFNNKLQRWSYPKVLNKLSCICEEQGIGFIKLNPKYTSQRCSKCGAIHKESRKGELYECIVCGIKIDVDYNASLNILHLGEYGLHAYNK
jgi:IS605 OrfB family transposase